LNFTKTKYASDQPTAIAIQSDGKILVSGYATTSSLSVLRFNANGTLDSTFGGGNSDAFIAKFNTAAS